ncbi:lysozyme inhibitor LprI family protein [Limnobacter sp. P1]|uniref:lysozyme inhibitor LprI family protein n=1 Tax=Limnobacter olei TaxID=3031298 RepID=UPI0023B032E9|nr:lysozyme inhibitor LprI family protein [Limnobacter sp. P1]
MINRLIISFCFFSLPLIANATHCDKVLANDKLIVCLGDDYNEADKRLNEVYKSLRTKLGPEEKQSLKHSQRAWLNKRDDQYDAEAAPTAGGQVYQPTYIQCQIDMTNSRVKLLKARKW